MADKLTPDQLSRKAEKIIKMNKSEAIVNQVYFNPMFTNELSHKVEELAEYGFILAQTETESENGAVIAGKVQSPSGTMLDLGSVLLDGKTTRINRDLTSISELVKFIEAEALVGNAD